VGCMSKKISVRIPSDDIWNDFKQFVEQKHHKKHTVLGMEVEEALKRYLYEEGFYGSPMYDENHNPPMSEPASIEGKHTHQQEDSSYASIYADLHGRKQIHREEFEGILTRRLGLKTDKSRRDHLKTFEHLGILQPHPVVGHKILTVNHEFMDL
jgi:hypothetical protein